MRAVDTMKIFWKKKRLLHRGLYGWSYQATAWSVCINCYQFTFYVAVRWGSSLAHLKLEGIELFKLKHEKYIENCSRNIPKTNIYNWLWFLWSKTFIELQFVTKLLVTNMIRSGSRSVAKFLQESIFIAFDFIWNVWLFDINFATLLDPPLMII